MINYSLILRGTVPGTVGGGQSKKIYAVAQFNQQMNLRRFCDHIADHGSTFDRGTIYGVATQIVACLREQLLLGNSVLLGDMGTFSVKISSKGATTVEDFQPETHIKRVYVNWQPGPDFRNLMEAADFQYVTTRAEQAAARKAAKAALAAETGGSGGSTSGPNTDDSNGE